MSEDPNKKIWVTLLEKVTHQYNAAVYSATNKSPFNLFLRRDGFNSVLNEQKDGYNNDEITIDSEINACESYEISKSQVKEKYLSRMDKKCVHNSKNDFSVGDFIIIKKDFDSNEKIKEIN